MRRLGDPPQLGPDVDREPDYGSPEYRKRFLGELGRWLAGEIKRDSVEGDDKEGE